MSDTPRAIVVPNADGVLAEADLYARFFRALGDPTRVRILLLLRKGETPVNELVATLGVGQGRVSTHLGCLRWCGLVLPRREGKQVFYRLADERISALLSLAAKVATRTPVVG